jgi:glycosyltransferase involved in cell wall biosynthesis
MRISVCIPTYNGEKYIKQQLDSILIQLGEDDEVIISDDSSSDLTVEIIKKINDDRINLIENCKFKSPIFNLENALKHAKGDYIYLSDQDDVWLSNKVSITQNYLEYYDVVVSDCVLVNEKGEIVQESFFKLNNSKKGLFNNLKRNSYIGCCMAFKRSVLMKILPFPKDIPMHDLWIGFVSEIYNKPIFIKDKLILYRRHNNTASSTGKKSKYSLCKQILFRLNCIKYLPITLFR